MQQLWAPWRMELIKSPRPSGCVFCEAPQAADLKASLVVHRGTHLFIILNKYPYNNGHLMVVPYRHVADLEALTPEEGAEMVVLLQQAVTVLKKTMAPNAFNIGMNLGPDAGAGIAEHLHFHVVPRWRGDTNFMPVLADTRVIGEHLEQTYDRLALAFQNVAS